MKIKIGNVYKYYLSTLRSDNVTNQVEFHTRTATSSVSKIFLLRVISNFTSRKLYDSTIFAP